MSTKTTIFGVVAIVALLVAGALAFTSLGRSQQPVATTAAEPTAQQPVATGDQVQAQEVTVGTGKQAAPGSVVSVLYVGKLQDGTIFDSSEAHNNQPLQFQLGAEGLIAGFQVGVNGMKQGGERLIAIPPALGYGAQDVKDETGKVIIPANSTLIFDIKLVKVEDAPPAPTQTAPKAN